NITGTLRAAVTLLPNGNVDKVEILHSSGYKLLDRAALQIVYLAAPYAPFPPEIRKTTDKLEIIRTWHFEISGLSTSR
ncbi:MAG: energy transducer TonB, partial [Cellvibrionaceae bacterium]|nr:energy transducer TonB [Cellvibrionaceae bacterium]